MASTLPEPNPCCESCPEETSVQVAGPTGSAGSDGSDGSDGVNAFTTTQEAFNMPAEGADTSSIEVGDSTWMTPTQVVYVQNAGWMQVRSKADSTHVVLRNLEDSGNSEYTENVAPSTNVPSSSQISPGGLQGPAGTAASGTAPDSASYWTRTSEGSLSGESAIDSLSDGVLQHTGGTPAQAPLATAVEGLGSNGLVTRTSSSAAAARTITGTTNRIDVTDGDGVSGDPTLDVGSDVYVAGGTDIPISDGGTGASTATAARTALGFITTTIAHAQYEEQQTSGTDGGAFNNGAWRTRALNTEVYDPNAIGSLATNQVTLGAGAYRLRAWATGYNVDNHQVRIQNITAGTTIGYGTNARAGSTDEIQNISYVETRVSLAGSTAIELQHRCETSKTSDGFGLANSFGGTEIYAGLSVEMET